MRTSLLCLVFAAVLGAPLPLNSQQRAPTTLEMLQGIKTENAALLARQVASLTKLETLAKEIAQAKIYAKRG